QGDLGGRTITQVLGVAADDRGEFGLQGVLVEIEVHHALAQASIGIEVFRLELAVVGDNRGLDRRRSDSFLLDRLGLLGAGGSGEHKYGYEGDTECGVHRGCPWLDRWL